MRYFLLLSFTFLLASLVVPCMSAADSAPKRELAGNMTVKYLVLPPEVEEFTEMFPEGVFYARLRSNFFYWDWDEESDGVLEDNRSWGVGGSLIYKSGRWNGLAFTAGFYTSHSPFVRMDRDDIGLLKAGKDVLSREEVRTDDDYSLTVLGEAFLDYDRDDWLVRAGRQLYESVFTASNDTKMIPNTFDGILLQSKVVPDTRIELAWWATQKLRDHKSSHDVITFRDEDGKSWGNQDDAGVHKGLSFGNFKAAGEDTEHDLWIGVIENKSITNLKLTLSGLSIPDVLAHGVIEAHYAIKAGDWKITPGARYFRQFDEDGGEIGGASLSGNVSAANPRGYTDPDNLEGSLWAARVVVDDPRGITKTLIGYSEVSDEADIVAPWRGFPTGGYTRAMGQYNWRANTSTWMLQFGANLGKAGWVEGLRFNARYAWMNFDEAKGFSDRTIFHLDVIQSVPWVAGLELKFRTALVDDKAATSYNEYRLEANFLF